MSGYYSDCLEQNRRLKLTGYRTEWLNVIVFYAIKSAIVIQFDSTRDLFPHCKTIKWATVTQFAIDDDDETECFGLEHWKVFSIQYPTTTTTITKSTHEKNIYEKQMCNEWDSFREKKKKKERNEKNVSQNHLTVCAFVNCDWHGEAAYFFLIFLSCSLPHTLTIFLDSIPISIDVFFLRILNEYTLR